MRDDRGMTLIEVLISMTLLSIVFLALIQSAQMAMRSSVQNEMRDEAVRVAEERMTRLRNTPFPVAPATNDLSPTAGTADPSVMRRIRSVDCTYNINRMVKQIDATNNIVQVTLTVTWKFRNVTYRHEVSTILRGQS